MAQRTMMRWVSQRVVLVPLLRGADPHHQTDQPIQSQRYDEMGMKGARTRDQSFGSVCNVTI